MKNVSLVIKHEISATLKKTSFWVMAFLFPLLIVGITVGMQTLITRSVTDTPELNAPNRSGDPERTIGYVDSAGLITVIPPDIPMGLLQAFPDESAAKAAIANQEIDDYLIIPTDYLQTGELVVVQGEYRPLSNTPGSLFKYVIDTNLTGDSALAATINNPAQNIERQVLDTHPSSGATDSLANFAPMSVLYVFIFLLVMSSGYMLQSVSREKENRTVEILLLSLQPRELMLGKILGVSLVALFQMVIWFGGVLLFFGQDLALLNNVAAIEVPDGFFVWALLFFLLGYLLYASLMGAIGALAPSAREGGQFTLLVLLPLMIPLWFNSLLIHTPNGPVAVTFSLFPLTAPGVMVTRLVATTVPFWQIAASLAGLVLATGYVVSLAARFFRADTLLSNSAINWSRIAHQAASRDS